MRGILRTTRILLWAALPVALLALTGCGLSDHTWAWKQADLDRNRFDLGLYRGADSGTTLAEWVTQGEVVAASGTSATPDGGDLEVVVKYTLEQSGGGFQADTGPEITCYRFVTTDGYAVEFDTVDCPS